MTGADGEEGSGHAFGRDIRRAYVDLATTAPQAVGKEASARLGELRLGRGNAIPLDAVLDGASINRAMRLERQRGALSNKVAIALVHRRLSRTTLGTLSHLWLAEGNAPGGAPSAVILLPSQWQEGPAASPFFSVTSPSGFERFRAIARATADRIARIGHGRPRLPEGIRRSNDAIGMLSPWFALRRAGADRERVHEAMKDYLGALGPEFADAIEWVPEGSDSASAQERTAPRRVTCCLKYAAGPQAFCGTCPLRQN